jgi:hypothetical protein
LKTTSASISSRAAAPVRLVEGARVVHRHAERRRVAGDRIEQAVAGEIEADVVGIGAAVAGTHHAAGVVVERDEAKIFQLDVRVIRREPCHHVPSAALRQQPGEVAALHRRIADRQASRARLEDVAAQGIEHGRMGDQAFPSG